MSFSKSLFRWLCAMAMVLASWTGAMRGQNQPSFDAFDPNADGNVLALVVQPDGKILIGGGFSTLQPNRFGARSVHFRIARLNVNGTVDETFQTRCDHDVTAIALQADGKILIGGKFSKVWGTGDTDPAGTNRNGLARLNANGTLDTTFDPHPMFAPGVDNQASPVPIVRAIAVQPADGKILIGGAFGTFANAPAANAPERLARLNPDGSIDTAFTTAANNPVQAIALQPDGKILVGGGFSRFRATGASALADAPYLVRLEANGALDPGFTTRPDNRVLAIKVAVDNSILVGGEFLHLAVGATNTTRTFFARLSSAGVVDNAFNPAPSAAVEAIAIQADGKIVFGGRFKQIRPNGAGTTPVFYAARVGHDGAFDSEFIANGNAPVAAIAIQSDTSVLLGGYFTSVGTRQGASGLRGRVARVQPDGLLEAAFAPQAGGLIRKIIKYPDPDNRMLAVGQFTAFAGVTRNNIVRLDANGVVDPTFSPIVNGVINTVALQNDGKMLIGGSFTRIGSESRPYLARLNADGTLDTTFYPQPNSRVSAIILQGDKIVIGGDFTTFQSGGTGTLTTRLYLARLNADGTVDATFQADCSSRVFALHKESDTDFLVGGEFTNITPNGGRSTFRRYLGRITGNGALDADFDPRPTGAVNVIAPQGDKLLIGGFFSGFFPESATALIERNNIARMSANGTVDSFDPNSNGPISTIAAMPDNTVVLGGSFTAFKPNGATTQVDRRFIAWFNQDGTIHASRTTQADDIINTTLALADGRVMVGGELESLELGGASSLLTEDHLARLAADGSPDPTFAPSVGVASGEVNTIVAQREGLLLVGGSFSNISGSRNTNLTRLSFTGAPDSNFGARFDGPINALFVRNPTAGVTTTSGPFVWFSAAGALRSGFSLAATSQLAGTVAAVLQMPDGKIVLGGTFTNNASGGAHNLLRLNADGTLDTAFNPGLVGHVAALALDSAGRILVGGEFKKIFNSDRLNFARITAAGALDALDVRFAEAVNTITVAAGDAFYVGGDFQTVRSHGQTSDTSRPYIARFNAEGALDTTFAPQINNSVYAILPQSGDRMLVGGAFTAAGTTEANAVVRLNSTNGTVDTTFELGFNGFVEDFAVQSDGKILAAGSFTVATADNDDSAPLFIRPFVARFSISSAGAAVIDDGFKPSVGSQVHSVSVDSQGRIIIGGEFNSIANPDTSEVTVRNYVARLNSNGVVDDTFNPQPSNSVLVVDALTSGPFTDSVIIAGGLTTVLPEALIFAGGQFNQVGNAALPNLVRMNADGSADPSYTPRPDAAVHAIAGLADGRVLVTGEFQGFRPTSPTQTPIARGRMAILSADGMLDDSFTTSADGPVYAVGLQPNGAILVGGSFTTVGGAAHTNLARMDSTGVVDGSFSPSTNGAVSTLVVQSDGKIVLTGAFTTVNGTARAYLARLNANGTLDTGFAPVVDGPVTSLALQSDGGMLIGGSFTTVNGVARARFARLTTSGAVDPAMTVGFDNEVRAILPLADGRAVVGGTFRVAGNRPRYLIARVPAAGGATQSVNVNAARTEITWVNGGTRAEFATVQFALSTDRVNWTDLGTATRTGAPGTWQLTVSPLPANQLYYLRARASLATSRNYSTGRFETQWQFLNDRIAGPRSIGIDDAIASGGNGTGGSGSAGGSTGGSGGTGGGSGGTGGGAGGGGSGGAGGGSSGGTANPTYHLTNFSVRARPDDGEKLIAGFVIRAAASERVVLRAVGPGLTAFNVAGVMPAPLLELYAQNGSLLATSTAWQGDAALAQAFTEVGAFALDPTSADTAQAPLLAPGIYTTHVSPFSGENGIALAEVYFAGSNEGASGLANLSARGPVGQGDAVLIVGFVVGGDQPRQFLIRGVGPGLLGFGVADALSDPSLVVFDQDGSSIASNNDWQTQTGSSTASQVSAAATATGAFALASGSKDAAIVLTLAPGLYTTHVSGTAAGTGLVEVYELP